uniref:Leucine-rich repeat-containing N-terminal plant-type domain-containing protein n=1 Tax=Lactuca sativa TaxID=4236 RepID=A0A9R1WWN3_LACSA|nr:hypothetical protein LSAT_V11C800444680 [Lactuca sativa]
MSRFQGPCADGQIWNILIFPEIELNAMAKGAEERYNHTLDPNENVIQVMKGVDLEYTTNWDIVFNMDLSSNKLVGVIPVELTALCMLLGLNLSNNHLSGMIPESIGKMTRLESLDLSGNKLTGMIPPSMAALTFLSHLNLSDNKLLGRIPTGHQLQTLIDDPSIYAGNEDLCGPPLPNNCSDHQDPITMPKKKHKAAEELMKWICNRVLGCNWSSVVEEAVEMEDFQVC